MTQCRNRCGVDVIWDEQHLLATPDGDAWVCSEPRPEVLLGRDKRSGMDDKTRQAIERDKLIVGRGFARLKPDGTVEHIPAVQMLIFDGEVDPKLVQEKADSFAKLMDAFNQHTYVHGPGPTAPQPLTVYGPYPTGPNAHVDPKAELAKVLELPDDELHSWQNIIFAVKALMDPIAAMYLTCPKCNARHIDEGEFIHKPHHTHSCQSCGLTWRPAIGHTVGVQFLPGFKNK